jgi:hypothetical protein
MKKKKGLLYTHPFPVVWQCTKCQIRALSIVEYEDRDHNHARLVMIIYNTAEPKHISCITIMNTIFTRIWDNFCLVHHPKIEGCLIIGHKVKHVRYTYFHENQRLWGDCLIYKQTQLSGKGFKDLRKFSKLRKHAKAWKMYWKNAVSHTWKKTQIQHYNVNLFPDTCQWRYLS